MKETLKKLRTENRYSQDLLAKILGISRLSYMKYESGEVEPPVEIVRKLAKIYKVPYKTIIDNELHFEHKTVSYADSFKYDSDYCYEVASPDPAYGSSAFSEYGKMSPNMVSQFSRILATLQTTILSLQKQLNDLQSSEAVSAHAPPSFDKSAGFSKKEYFSRIGSVQMDSSYIDELRSASLI